MGRSCSSASTRREQRRAFEREGRHMMGLERSATRRICVLPSSAPSALRPPSTVPRSSGVARRQGTVVARAYKVELKLNGGEVAEIEVEEDEYILDAVENAGLEVPYDCGMGVCMQCPAKLTSGEVDQTEGMIATTSRRRGTCSCASPSASRT